MITLGRRKHACGLYISDTKIRLAKIQLHDGGVKVQHSSVMPLEEGLVSKGIVYNSRELSGHLEQLALAAGLKGERVYMSVPVGKTIMRRLVLPAAGQEEMRKQIDVEIHSWQFLPFKEFLFDYVPLGAPYVPEAEEAGRTKRRAREQEVLVFVTSKEIVQQHVEAAKHAGFYPAAVELAPLALQRMLFGLDRLGLHGLEELYAILHIESDEVNLSIFEDGIPVFMRSLHTNAVQSGLELEKYYQDHATQMLAAEIVRMINYYVYSVAENQAAVSKLYLAGDFRRVQTVAEFLEKTFKGDMEPLPLQLLVKQTEDIPYDYIIPIGLAMKGA
jgi:type IV pilus assembly protein PilM